MGNVYPVKATSSGGRAVRTDEKFGNIFDHFNTVYEWADGTKCFSSCRQWASTSTDVSDWIYGTEGVAELQSHTIKSAKLGEWKHEKAPDDNMYQNEHNALFASIRQGEPINDGQYMCDSTLMAIMGRLSAYTGKTLTWEEVSNSQLDRRPGSNGVPSPSGPSPRRDRTSDAHTHRPTRTRPRAANPGPGAFFCGRTQTFPPAPACPRKT